jgi:hypothetical protein
MNRKQVESSNIRSIGYDEENEILEIEFKRSGDVYEYFDVPFSVYEELMNAPSQGVYFSSTIRNDYRFEKK